VAKGVHADRKTSTLQDCWGLGVKRQPHAVEILTSRNVREHPPIVPYGVGVRGWRRWTGTNGRDVLEEPRPDEGCIASWKKNTCLKFCYS
jgi:hypothetical protein